MSIEINDLECKRFGIVAARLANPADPLEAIDAAADAAGVDMITARVDVEDLPRVHALEHSGYRLMDTLVYYDRRIAGQLETAGGHSIRLATPSDSADVAALARAAFADYIGHYHADPRLDRAAADAAYVEWAETSTQAVSDAAPVLVAQDNGALTGFLTMRRNMDQTYEIVLNAVHPGAGGRGVYGSLVVHALNLAHGAGGTRMIVSTQINNYAVQRVWSRLGFCHYKSLYTFHKWYGP